MYIIGPSICRKTRCYFFIALTNRYYPESYSNYFQEGSEFQLFTQLTRETVTSVINAPVRYRKTLSTK